MAPFATSTFAPNVLIAASNGAAAKPTEQPRAAKVYRFDTLSTHNTEPEAPTGALVPSITLATAYQQEEVGIAGGFAYSRFSNPNRDAFEKNIAALEGGKHAIAYASGTAVTTSLLSLVPHEGHIVSVSSIYGGTHKIFTQIVSKTHKITTSFVDLSKGDEAAIQGRLCEAIQVGKTKLFWIETPTNPDLSLVDIRLVSRVAKVVDPELVVVVDSTFTTPWYQNPLDLGADVVMHSVTKYINGHSDVLMGIAVTSDDNVAAQLRMVQASLGSVPSPFDCWLAMRGVKTLAVRMREHGRKALQLAKWMESHPLIKQVIYPGLPSHPSFELVAKQIAPKALRSQQEGGVDTAAGIEYSGMLSFRLNCDPLDPEPAARLLKELRVITLALSLGGVESLIEQPSTMTHWMVPEAERLGLGIGHDLIRLSVGLEDVDDMIEDFDAALHKALGSEQEAKVDA